MQVSSALLDYKVDDLLLVAVDTQRLVSHHKTVLAGKLSQDQCEKCSNLCWLPFASSSEIGVLWKQGTRSADIPSVCPGNLSVPIWPLPCLSVLMVEHPSSCHIISRHNLPYVHDVKNLVVNSGFVLEMFCFNKLFTVSSYFLSLCFFRARDLILALAPAAFPQVAIQRSSMSLVRLSTPLGTSNCVLPESLGTSSRYNDRCTHDIVIKLQTLCCSPFSVVAKQNDPAAAAYLCSRRHCPMIIISQNTEIWVEHCPSGILTSCTILVAVLTVFILRVVTSSWSFRTGCLSLMKG